MSVQLVELSGAAAGLAVATQHGVIFFSGLQAYDRLDGQTFPSIEAIRKALRQMSGWDRKSLAAAQALDLRPIRPIMRGT